jgi:hypothetical protein
MRQLVAAAAATAATTIAAAAAAVKAAAPHYNNKNHLKILVSCCSMSRVLWLEDYGSGCWSGSSRTTATAIVARRPPYCEYESRRQVKVSLTCMEQALVRETSVSQLITNTLEQDASTNDCLLTFP